MNIEIDCVTCQVNQIIRTIQISKTEDWASITSKAIQVLSNNLEKGTNVAPAFLSSEIQKVINNELECNDPYKKIRANSNIIAKSILRDFEYRIKKPSLKEYCLLSAASNAIDFAVINTVEECESKIKESFDMGFLKDDFHIFQKLLKSKKTLLFFPDNSGEVVFDKVLITAVRRYFDISIKVVTNKNPILNDTTSDEIVELGFKDVVDDIIEIEPEFMGIDIDGVHKYLKDYFTKDSFIVSKGMANYECFHGSNIDIPIIVILLVKCNPVAKSLGVTPLGAPVIASINSIDVS